MTVSRVLNGHPNIRDATRDRVLQAIQELNYTRSAIARALATRRAMRIGVLVDSAVEYGPSSTARAFERAARAAGYAITTATTPGEPDATVDDAAISAVSRDVDALCVIAPRASSLELVQRREAGVPTVLITPEPHPVFATVGVDQQLGALLAVNHLLSLGHREIVHLGGPLDWYDARARAQGWRVAMEQAGLAPKHLAQGDWTSDSGYAFARRMDLAKTTALFAANDQMALGAIHGLVDRGVSVPREMSVLGFDDVPDARHYLPPLTTVRQDFAALGATALEVLVESISGDIASRHAAVEPHLIERGSTGPVRPA